MSKDTRNFFVGYLDMSPSLKAFMAVVAAFLLGAAAGLAFLVSFNQDDPGSGRWDGPLDSDGREIIGRLDMAPYPLVTLTEGEAAGETVMVVANGKFGVDERLAPHDGETVRLRGNLAERKGQKLFQLMDGDDGISTMDIGSQDRPAVTDLGEITLRGQIVDSKCFLGVMKPGQGKAHKSCATLCILGGIPPSLMIRHGEGADDYSLLLITGPDGQAIKDELIPYVADPIRVSGRLERFGSLKRLRIDPDSIERL